MSRKAFTLAEVLITLTIIGVIAVLTIPNLMRKWQDRHTVSAVKEAYSILDNAFKMAIRENGTLDEWNWPLLALLSSDNSNYVAEQLIPFLRVKTYCGSSREDTGGCYSYAGKKENLAYYKNLNDSIYGIYINNPATRYGGKMMLQNGMTLAFSVLRPEGAGRIWPWMLEGNSKLQIDRRTYIGDVLVDINGKKGPNQFGIDVFLFPFGFNGILISRELSGYDNSNFAGAQKSACYNKNSSGLSCSTWIILHNNVDYKYRDVSAEW